MDSGQLDRDKLNRCVDAMLVAGRDDQPLEIASLRDFFESDEEFEIHLDAIRVARERIRRHDVSRPVERGPDSIPQQTNDSDIQIVPWLPGRFTNAKELGSGGQARVYTALDSKVMTRVAVKYPNGNGQVERFMRERDALSKIRSQNVVKLYECLESPEQNTYPQVVLVMESVDGECLTTMTEAPVLSHDEIMTCMDLMIDTANGMLAIHEAGVIHRDLKPENILNRNGQAVIIDFGLAAVDQNHSLTQTAHVMGTYRYMAPEQLESAKKCTIKSDIYSFGATFYHILAGKPPFDVSPISDACHESEASSLNQVNEVIPESLSNLVSRCVTVSPTGRFADFSEVRDKLEELKKEYIRNGTASDSAVWDRFPTSYKFSNGRMCTIHVGEIPDATSDVTTICCFDNDDYTMSSGIAKQINMMSGGDILERIGAMYTDEQETFTTPTHGNLPFHSVIHVRVSESDTSTDKLKFARDLVRRWLVEATKNRVSSLAIPLVGDGIIAISLNESLDVVFQMLRELLIMDSSAIRNAVIFICPEQKQRFDIKQLMEQLDKWDELV